MWLVLLIHWNYTSLFNIATKRRVRGEDATEDKADYFVMVTEHLQNRTEVDVHGKMSVVILNTTSSEYTAVGDWIRAFAVRNRLLPVGSMIQPLKLKLKIIAVWDVAPCSLVQEALMTEAMH